MSRIVSIILGLILLAPFSWAEEQIPLEEQKAKDSYSLGYDFGGNLKRQGVDIDKDLLLSAVLDGLNSKKPRLSPEEMREILLQLRKKLMAMQDQRFREFAAKNLEEGKAFLEANKAKEGVKTLPSGLQYKVLKEGNGPIPKETDAVKVHYRGTLIGGQEFDNSYHKGEPATLNIVGAIKGWREALQLMNAGSTWQLFIPPDLGYGKRQFGRIPPNSTLIFELEFLSLADPLASESALPIPDPSTMVREDRHSDSVPD